MHDVGRSPLRGSGLRPFGAEPAAQSQAKPLVPNADPSRLAIRLLTERAEREKHLRGISDEMWVMMLDLWANYCRGRRVTVSDLCRGAYAPATTALRHLGQLVECGLAERVDDDEDGRRVFIRLTEDGLARLDAFRAAAMKVAA